MVESDRQPVPASPEDKLLSEVEVREKLAENLARDSKKSAILGFIAGAVVVAGLAATFISTIRTQKSLETQIGKTDSLQVQVKAKDAEAQKATQDAATVKTVLGATMEELQTKGPDVSLTARTAIDHAFEANPTAANLLVRVYIHIRIPSQRARAFEIARALRKAGYVVPGIDVQPYPAGAYSSTEVHYYTDDSKSISDARAIQKAAASSGIPVITAQASPKGKQPPHAYGLWLASGLQ